TLASLAGFWFRRTVCTTNIVTPIASSAPAEPPTATANGVQFVVSAGGRSSGSAWGTTGSAFSSDGTFAVSAAIGSMTPWPMYWSCPSGAAGWCAVYLMRSMTCVAVSFGYLCRTSAATPHTYGAAKLVPSTGAASPLGSMVWLTSRSEPSAGSSEMMSVPGAATLTHGPFMLKFAAPPLSSMAATDSTWSEKIGGET